MLLVIFLKNICQLTEILCYAQIFVQLSIGVSKNIGNYYTHKLYLV